MNLRHRTIGLILAGGLFFAGCSNQPAMPVAMDEYRQGVESQKANDFQTAIEHYENAVKADPNLRMASAKLADLYRTTGKYQQAVQQYEIAAQLDPYSATDQYYLGVCYQFLNRLKDAVAAYLRALDLSPQDAKSNMNLGIVYLLLGQTQPAAEKLHRATQLDPLNGSAWLNYGVSLDAVGKLGDAETAYRKAIELNAPITLTLEDLAGNLIAQKRASEARAVCEQLLLRHDSPVARARYGQAMQLQGDDDGALLQFDYALKRDPNSTLALSCKGFVLIDEYAKGMELDEPKRTEALALWRKSLSINDNQPRVKDALEKWKKAQLTGS